MMFLLGFAIACVSCLIGFVIGAFWMYWLTVPLRRVGPPLCPAALKAVGGGTG